MENIVAKANKSLGFVRRNLYPCSERTKRSAYVTIVRPNLEYATAVWDHTAVKRKNPTPLPARRLELRKSLKRKPARLL